MANAARPPIVEEFVRHCDLRQAKRGAAAQLLDEQGTRLRQRGEMRLGEEQPWMPFEAEQQIASQECQFLWRARFRRSALVRGVVEDAYAQGRGRLDVRLWGWLPVARARGAEVDQGELQRYLAELPWCPGALQANPALRFRQLSGDVVRVWCGREAHGVELVFDSVPQVVATRCEARPRGKSLQPWSGRFWDYRDFDGWRAPARGEARWHGGQEPFCYWRGEVIALR